MLPLALIPRATDLARTGNISNNAQVTFRCKSQTVNCRLTSREELQKVGNVYSMPSLERVCKPVCICCQGQCRCVLQLGNLGQTG